MSQLFFLILRIAADNNIRDELYDKYPQKILGGDFVPYHSRICCFSAGAGRCSCTNVVKDVP